MFGDSRISDGLVEMLRVHQGCARPRPIRQPVAAAPIAEGIRSWRTDLLHQVGTFEAVDTKIQKSATARQINFDSNGIS